MYTFPAVSLLLLLTHVLPHQMQSVFFWLMASHLIHSPLCVFCSFQSYLSWRVFGVMCKPSDSYLSNSNTFTHHLGFESNCKKNPFQPISSLILNYLFEMAQRFWDTFSFTFKDYVSQAYFNKYLVLGESSNHKAEL